jgi:hypothetical protein
MYVKVDLPAIVSPLLAVVSFMKNTNIEDLIETFVFLVLVVMVGLYVKLSLKKLYK